MSSSIGSISIYQTITNIYFLASVT